MKLIAFFVFIFFQVPPRISGFDVSYGLLDEIAAKALNKSLVEVAAKLGDLQAYNFTIDSGDQEFGTFRIDLSNITVVGLDQMMGETIKVNVPPPGPLRISNLTLYIPYVNLTAQDYLLGGQIEFPIGNKILPLSGTGGFLQFSLSDFRLSFDITLKSNGTGGGMVVDELVMYASTRSMNFHADNLMGGDKVGWSFNTVLNDVATVAFDYYKDPLIDYYSDTFKNIIESVICQVLPFCNNLGK